MKRNIHGILLLDKPKAITSNAALQIVKRLFGAKKAGHTGSLDPIASGLLPICFGEGTKYSRFLLEADKHYRVTAKLGVRTASGDSEGDILSTRPSNHITEQALKNIFPDFMGDIEQVPPMFSAIKFQGKPLYKLARQGIEIERASRSITIYELNLVSLENDMLTLEVRASKGTYIRTLVDDIGERLGCGAHVVELRRLGVGGYLENQMVPLSLLEHFAKQQDYAEMDACLLPLDTALSGLPTAMLSDSAAYYLMQGQPVRIPDLPLEGWVRLTLKDGRFLGVGEVLEDGRVAPRRLRIPSEVC